MAGADSLCPNLVNSSNNGGFHAKGFQMIWQDMVLLCLDGFGLKQVSVAVKYLEKPQLRDVSTSILVPLV